MLVHILEVAVALLLLATAVQLVRCNRTFNKEKQTPLMSTAIISEKAKPVEKSYGKSANILHDYIGEFFVDETINDELEAYKNADVAKTSIASQAAVVSAVTANSQMKSNALDSNNERSNILSFEERVEITSDKVLSEDEDDSVITVLNSSHAPDGVADENVMSDKVVHAMLDEAKLVCAS